MLEMVWIYELILELHYSHVLVFKWVETDTNI